ncbi:MULTISPECIES: PilZ domain-containing protein [Acinetobacter]|uniref:PilZ domain-containing protein n=1 Tax=Acinetobacter piscicola TaxID=2006115 RepID=A0A4Q4H0X3_9GAMM|nr:MULTISPECIES: PilZ domain-containing protein [Acinetobacter]MDM1756038.1 PilZ domain-containing protein [Acinetobacter sp. 256-1]MDM1760520.1 PilZ domain-containing protein [Acinetobacter sp. 251-1]QOW45447.1 PilZ domain-containing protein [Acinetobacter piscicola]RYL28503.1 PilZ domain-containing protein [Acinetobacter piscicola]
METLQHQTEANERRVMSRIDAALRINYQIISDDVALNDPYDPNFVLPRYFLLLAELDQFDHALQYELDQLNEKDQQIARILSLFNQKLNLITGSLYDSIVQTMLPTPQNVNFSESGFSFFSKQNINEGTYIHVTLSHAENFFHIAATAQIAYSERISDEQEDYRIGAYFVTLHPQDRVKLAECVKSCMSA